MKFILQLVATLLAALGVMSAANAAGSFMQIYQGTAGNTPGNTISCGSPAVGSSVACPAVRFQWTACNIGGCDEAYYQNSNVTVSNTTEFSASVTSCSTTTWVGSGVVCTVWLTYTPTANGSHSTGVTLNGKLYDWYMAQPVKTAAYSFSANGGVAASYDWNTGSWSAWSSTCSDAATRTRAVTCLQNGYTPVDDSFCAGTKPTASETSGLYSGCSYAWNAGAFGVCAGGSGSWQVGNWAPALGCGSTAQSRSVTCAVDVNSGTHSRTVTCLRSDGAEAASELCGSPAPATSESCTPADTAVCGTAPAESQTVTLTNDCPSGDDGEGNNETPPGPTSVKKELCAPDAANHKFCVWMPL